FGMWALFVLTRREVRQGFARVGARGARHEEAPATDQATRPLPRLGSRERRWILKEAAALVLLVAAAVAITEFSGLTTFFRGSSARYPVTLEMDDPDIVVRIWPTAQTEPPANLAGPFEILGKPAYTIQNVTSKEVSLPAGNYWLAAELDEQEVHRVFVKVQADSLHVNYQDKFGPTMSWVGREIRGLPKTIAIPGAANLVQKETSKLQGAWRMVAAEMDGRPFPKKMFEEDNPRLVFAGDRVTHLKQGEVQKETGYTLNPRNKPAAMDIPNSAFFSRGKTALAIYRWEGDALRICASPLERPSDFTTTPGSERIAFVLQKERTKEDAARRRAVAPFVVLAKDAKAERQFATLAEADAECHSGDTIEIRGDGPFETDPLVLDKALTLRAGKG